MIAMYYTEFGRYGKASGTDATDAQQSNSASRRHVFHGIPPLVRRQLEPKDKSRHTAALVSPPFPPLPRRGYLEVEALLTSPRSTSTLCNHPLCKGEEGGGTRGARQANFLGALVL